MEYSSLLQSDLVRSLSTKFFYKGDQLYFLITLVYGEAGAVLLKEFDNYDTYRTNHNFLVKALNEQADIPDNFSRL